jgi:glycine oxidase
VALRTLGARSLALFDGFVARVAGESSTHVDYARTGTLQVAREAGEVAALEALAARLAADAISHQLVDGRGVARLEPGLGPATAGLLIPAHGWVAVQRLTEALQEAATGRGVTWSAEPLTIEQAAGSADVVVVATGAWAGEPVRPVRGQLVHLKLEAPPVTRVVWGQDCYVVPWPDGSLLIGATVEDVGFDESVTPAAVRALAAAAAALVPAARGARIQDVRVGLRPSTPDELPAIGRSSTMPDVFYATGHYRTGVLMAPLTADLIADLVLEQRVDPLLALVRPDRFGL